MNVCCCQIHAEPCIFATFTLKWHAAQYFIVPCLHAVKTSVYLECIHARASGKQQTG